MILVDGQPLDKVAKQLKRKYRFKFNKEAVMIKQLINFWLENHKQDEKKN